MGMSAGQATFLVGEAGPGAGIAAAIRGSSHSGPAAYLPETETPVRGLQRCARGGDRRSPFPAPSLDSFSGPHKLHNNLAYMGRRSPRRAARRR